MTLSDLVASDPLGLSLPVGGSSGSVSINEIPNMAPQAVNDSAATNEDEAVTINVLANDSDPDGDNLTVTGVSQGNLGTISILGSTNVLYTPLENHHSSDTFTYTISDGRGGTDQATVTVTINPVNDLPQAVNDEAATSEGQPVTISVLANDSDVDEDNLSVTQVTQGAHGSVTINAGTTVTYSPGTNFFGSDGFTYTVSDGHGGSDTASVLVNVTEVNGAPNALNDSATTNEDQAIAINVLANDTDPDGDTLSLIEITQGTHGSVVDLGGGSLRYRPQENYHGGDSFAYVVSDGNGESDEALVSLTINPVNDLPVAVNDEAATSEGQPVTIPVLVNDSDVDEDSLSVSGVTQGTNGSVAINGGTSVTYTPTGNFSGQDSFTYTLSDGQGGTDTASVLVQVSGVNDPPSAVNDSVSTDEDVPVTVSVLANDSDPDGDELVLSSVTQGQNGWVSIAEAGLAARYIPNDNFHGTDSFTYTISDGQGGADTAAVTVTIHAVNDRPDARDDQATALQRESVVLDVLSNDVDVDEDDLSVTSLSQPEHGTAQLNSDQSVNYMPDSDFFGQDSFTYTISDGNGGTDTATVFLSITESNQPPTASPDQATTPEDQSVVILVLSNDSDPDQDPLSITAVTQPSHGAAEIVEAGQAVRYTPAENFHGNDSFAYSISDGNEGGLAEAVVSMTVQSVNDAPQAADDEGFTKTDEAVTIPVLANDTDADQDTLSVVKVDPAANGTVTINPQQTITYSPNADFHGEDSFSYTASDGKGGTDSANVRVQVTQSNQPPTAVDDQATTSEDQSVVISVLANDSDPDEDPLNIHEVSQTEHGSVEIIEGTSIRYTPAENYYGADSFQYGISDGKGGTATAAVLVSILAVNDQPVAEDDIAESVDSVAKTEAAATPMTIEVLANDSDPDGDPLSVTEISAPLHGTAELSGDLVIYTPLPGNYELDTFSYTIIDGHGGSDSAIVTIRFAQPNQPPQAVDDSARTTRNKGVNIDVLFNDSDPDGDSLLLVEVTKPANGSVEIRRKGNVKYTPNRQYTGPDAFEYSVSDGKATASARVELEVLPNSSKGKKLVFPASVNTGDRLLKNTYVGVGLLNPSYQADYIQLRSYDSEGIEIDDVQLGEPLPPQGQAAFLTEEAIEFSPESLSMTAEGIMGSLQGFFMIGDHNASRLDGVGAEIPEASQLYFPMVRQKDSETTLLHLFNRDEEADSELTLELFNAQGILLERVEGTIPPSGAILGSVAEIFNEEVQVDEGYVRVTSEGALAAGFELVANENFLASLSARPPYSAKRLLAPQFLLDEANGSTSILRILNADNWNAKVTVDAFDDDSNLLASKTVKIEPKELWVEDLRNIFEEVPKGLVTGFLKLNIGGLIGSSASLVGSITYEIFNGRASTTLPFVEEGRTELIFPHIAQTADGSIYTGFSILNAEEVPVTVTIEAFNQKGYKIALKEISLEPGRRVIDLVRSETFFGKDFEQVKGHVRIRSTGKVVTFAVFGDSAGNFLSTIEGQDKLE